MQITNFWIMADETRLETEYRADEKLNFLKNASIDSLQKICLQYRYFTQDFSSNLGVLISRMPPGKFKTLLGEILNEELGEGRVEDAHLNLYDSFLTSIQIPEAKLHNSLHPNNSVLLEEIRGLISVMPAAYGIGLVGMGGECLCQIYLSNMYDKMRQNPYLKEYQSQIHLAFWEFHAGAGDVIHRQKVRQAIDEFCLDEPINVEYLAAGYSKAKHNWDKFWDNNFRIATQESFTFAS